MSNGCPICAKPVSPDFRPFCSKRCADVDLNRWLKGVYAVPVTETDDEDGDKAQNKGKGRNFASLPMSCKSVRSIRNVNDWRTRLVGSS